MADRRDHPGAVRDAGGVESPSGPISTVAIAAVKSYRRIKHGADEDEDASGRKAEATAARAGNAARRFRRGGGLVYGMVNVAEVEADDHAAEAEARGKGRGGTHKGAAAAASVADGGGEEGEPTTEYCRRDDDWDEESVRVAKLGLGSRLFGRGSDGESKETKGDTKKALVEGDEKSVLSQQGSVYVLDVYEFRQNRAYLSYLVSMAQTLILLAMSVQCGLAPLNINPMCGPYPDALSYWGAANSALIIDEDERWRLLTPVLLHAGIFHLMGNVSVQLDAGAFFEREWGSIIWLLVYVCSAIGGSILSTVVFPDMISVGSSGAVMGLFGAKLSELFCRACESRSTLQGRAGHAVRRQQCVGTFCAVGLVMGFSFVPYVDWAAHLGGLLAGMSVGLIIFSCYVQTIIFKLLWFVTGVIFVVMYYTESVGYMYSVVEPNDMLKDVCEYYKSALDGFECSCQKDDFDWSKFNIFRSYDDA